MDAPNRLLQAALEIQEFCESRRWRFCFIGGIAVQHWGEARLTRDADLTVFTGALADRPQDWLDIEGIVAKSGARIDWDEVRADLRPLLELKGEDAALRRLQDVLSRHSAS